MYYLSPYSWGLGEGGCVSSVTAFFSTNVSSIPAVKNVLLATGPLSAIDDLRAFMLLNLMGGFSPFLLRLISTDPVIIFPAYRTLSSDSVLFLRFCLSFVLLSIEEYILVIS